MSTDDATINGQGTAVLTGPDGQVKAEVKFVNVITQTGNSYYVERAAGIAGAPAAATGMQLGTGTTAPSTTGAGAALGSLVAGSLVALTGAPTGGAGGTGTSRRAQYVTTWAAGTATSSALAEVVLVNQATGTQTVAPAAATISRALLTPTIDKQAGDTLTLTWNHDIGS